METTLKQRQDPLMRKRFYLYFVPLFLLPFFATVFFVKLAPFVLLASLGVGFFLLHEWEKKTQRAVEVLMKNKSESQRYERKIAFFEQAEIETQAQIEELNFEVDKKVQEYRLLYLEREDLKREHLRLQEEMSQVQRQFEQEVNRKEALLSDYQKTITEQRSIIEKKQRHITALEGKVRELTVEQTRPVLAKQKEDSVTYPFPPAERKERATYDLGLALQKYLEVAMSFTGADHLGYRFLDLTLESYGIDQRRLFDHFREDSGAMIFVYSLNEGKFLFFNNFTKEMLGWSPEKMVKDFALLVSEGYEEWKRHLLRMETLQESSLRLVLKSKEGREIPLQCLMGLVSAGPFIKHVIGVLAPV